MNFKENPMVYAWNQKNMYDQALTYGKNHRIQKEYTPLFSKSWTLVCTRPQVKSKLQSYKRNNKFNVDVSDTLKIAKTFHFCHDALSFCGHDAEEVLLILNEFNKLHQYLQYGFNEKVADMVMKNKNFMLYVIGEVDSMMRLDTSNFDNMYDKEYGGDSVPL